MPAMKLYYETAPAEGDLTQRVNVAFHVVRTRPIWTGPEANTRARLSDNLEPIRLDNGEWTINHKKSDSAPYNEYHFYTGDLTEKGLADLIGYVTLQGVPVESAIPKFTGVKNPFDEPIPKERLGYGFLESKRTERPKMVGGLGYGFGYGYMGIVPFRSKVFGERWRMAKVAREFYKGDDNFGRGKIMGAVVGAALYTGAAACAVWFVNEFGK